MGRPQLYTDESIISALDRTKGLIYLAARALGCSPTTLYSRAESNPAIRAAIKQHRGLLVDTAEEKLWQAVQKGQSWAVIFVLKTLGRSRGYVERKEVRIAGDRKALPIQKQTVPVCINPDELPLSLRIALLNAIREQKQKSHQEGNERP